MFRLYSPYMGTISALSDWYGVKLYLELAALEDDEYILYDGSN
jgi:hypothetical protein